MIRPCWQGSLLECANFVSYVWALSHQPIETSKSLYFNNIFIAGEHFITTCAWDNSHCMPLRPTFFMVPDMQERTFSTFAGKNQRKHNREI